MENNLTNKVRDEVSFARRAALWAVAELDDLLRRLNNAPPGPSMRPQLERTSKRLEGARAALERAKASL